MIEVNKTYNLLPDIDQRAYGEYTKKAIGTLLKAPGLVELRAQRNILGSPMVRLTIVWQTLADWAKFAENAERWTLESQLQKFATNIKIEIWGASPALPQPLRPTK